MTKQVLQATENHWPDRDVSSKARPAKPLVNHDIVDGSDKRMSTATRTPGRRNLERKVNLLSTSDGFDDPTDGSIPTRPHGPGTHGKHLTRRPLIDRRISNTRESFGSGSRTHGRGSQAIIPSEESKVSSPQPSPAEPLDTIASPCLDRLRTLLRQLQALRLQPEVIRLANVVEEFRQCMELESSTYGTSNPEEYRARGLVTDYLEKIEKRSSQMIHEIHLFSPTGDYQRLDLMRTAISPLLDAITEDVKWMRQISGTLDNDLGSVRTSHSIDSAPANGLSPLEREFLLIPSCDFNRYKEFISGQPDILNVNAEDLQKAITQAMSVGDHKLASRWVEAVVVIRECAYLNADGILQYLQDLQNELADSHQQFQESCNRLFEALLFRSEAAGQNLVVDRVEPNRTSQTQSKQFENIDLSGRRDSELETVQVRATLPRHMRQHQDSADSVDRTGIKFTTSSRTPHQRVGLVREYFVRAQPRAFFVIGRVFKILWHEPVGTHVSGLRPSPGSTSTGVFGESIYSSIRWMVVVVAKHGHALCCPISTYGGMGLRNKNITEAEIQAHAVIYSVGSRPSTSDKEPQMMKQPIAVELTAHVSKMDPACRVDFSRCYTIMWNNKVLEVGRVSTQQLRLLKIYFMAELESQ